MNRTTYIKRKSHHIHPLAIALSSLLASSAMPAFAADQACRDANGNSIAGSTNAGNEHGDSNTTCKADASAYGELNNASAVGSNAFGLNNAAYGQSGNAFGNSNTAKGNYSNAFGNSNIANGPDSNAFGFGNTANGAGSIAFGRANYANGDLSSALGAGNTADGTNSTAIGFQSKATNLRSTAIGYQAIADRDYAIAVGKTGGEHQIIHMADGTQDFDAVNVRQLRTLADWMGGGSSFVNGVFTAPTFVIQGSNYNSVASAFAAVDSRLTALGQGGIGGSGPAGPAGDSAYQIAVNNGFSGTEQQWLASLKGDAGPMGPQGPAGIDGAPGPQGPAGTNGVDGATGAQGSQGATGVQGPAGAQGATGADGASAYQIAVNNGYVGTEQQWLNSLQGGGSGNDALAVHYDDSSKATVTLQGTNGTQLKNVAAGTTATDAVNVQQMQQGNATTLASANAHSDAGDVATLTSANAHADAGDAATLTAAKSYTDNRINGLVGAGIDQFRGEVNRRFVQQDRRIDRMGAMSGAMSAAALNTAGLPGQNRVGVGFGNQNGRAAMAVSYQRLVRPNASVSLSGGFSGSERSIAVGAGFSW